MTPHFIGKRDCTERWGLAITRRWGGGGTHMHFQSKIGHVPVRAIRRETIKSGSFSKRDAAPVLLCRPEIQLVVNFHLVFTATSTKKKPSLGSRTLSNRLSSASQWGSTADGTADRLHQRPHEHGGRTRLVRALYFLPADWLARLSIARLPGNQNHLLAPAVRHTTLLLASIFFTFLCGEKMIADVF